MVVVFNKIFVGLLICFSGLLSANSAYADDALQMPPTPIEASVVTVKTIEKTVSAQGELKAYKQVILQSDIPGKIVQLNIPEGKEIPAGALLIKLEDSVFKATVKQAQSQYDHQLIIFNRQKRLVEKGTGSQSDLEDAKAQLSYQSATLELAQAQLSKTEIIAPFEGNVGLKDIDVGDYINPGQALVELVDIDKILIDFYLPERYLTQVSEQTKITLNVDAIPGVVFEGIVTAISPSLSQSLRALHIKGVIENPEHRLKPGLFARLSVVVDTIPSALLVPDRAIVYKDNQNYVYKINDNNTVTLVPVQMGMREDNYTQIISGLFQGEQVVTAGQIKLYEGAKVTVVTQP